MSDVVIEQIVREMQAMPEDLQKQVLQFVAMLRASRPAGVPGRDLLPFAGMITAEDLGAMRQAVVEGCERADENEW